MAAPPADACPRISQGLRVPAHSYRRARHERNLSDDRIKRIAERGGLIGIGYWDTAVCDPSLEGIVAVLRHVADLVGVEHVALGSDYDGSTEVPFDTSELPALTEHLIETGFNDQRVIEIDLPFTRAA